MTPIRQSYRGRAFTAMVLCLAAAASWTEFRRPLPVVAVPDPSTLSEDTFEELKDNLPPHGVVGYLSDLDPHRRTGSAAWYGAEYSLAPIVLDPGTDRDQVVGIFTNPSVAADLIERRGLEVVRRYDAGLMLLRRKNP